MLKKILVPLDGSALSEAALPYAAQIAAKTGSQVVLLHVNGTAYDSGERMRQLYMEKLSETLGLHALTVHLAGNAAERIIDYAGEAGIDLIVMTTHGETGAKRWALGSVADKVVRSSRHPVFLVRSRETASGIRASGQMKKVLIPLDGSEAAESILPFVEEVAPVLGITVALFQALGTGFPSVVALGYEHNQHAAHPLAEIEKEKAAAASYLKKIAARLKAKNIETETYVEIGDAAGEILKKVGEASADLVAMATHGRSGPARWVMGSVADKVLHEGTAPLLLVRSPGARVE
ncbi:MAG: universal stress protein [Dehalococcoidia bacterium]|nr:universal stress protein [Dehalococcoidia bacterium]